MEWGMMVKSRLEFIHKCMRESHVLVICSIYLHTAIIISYTEEIIYLHFALCIHFLQKKILFCVISFIS